MVFLNKQNKEIFILYCIFFVFLLSLFFKSHDSAINQVIVSIFTICLILTYLISKMKVSFNILFLILFLILIFYFLLAPILNTYSYGILVYILCVSYYFFFTKMEIKIDIFLKFINLTYSIYLLFSFFVWSGIIPNIFYDMTFFQVPEFYVNFGFISYYIMPGFDGSPAGLDIYSALVVFLNLLFNQTKSKYIFIIFGIIGIILTFRMTPFAAILVTFILYPLFKYRLLSILIISNILFVFMIVLYLLMIDFTFSLGGNNFDIWTLGYKITHARTMIWEQQLNILFNSYTLNDYIFGNFSVSNFEVPHYQIWGQIRGDEYHGNPHNTYLLLFFRMPLLTVLFICIFLILLYKNYNKKRFTIIFLIFLAGFTNSSIISLGNPIFIVITTYLLSQKRNKIEEKNFSYSSGT